MALRRGSFYSAGSPRTSIMAAPPSPAVRVVYASQRMSSISYALHDVVRGTREAQERREHAIYEKYRKIRDKLVELEGNRDQERKRRLELEQKEKQHQLSNLSLRSRICKLQEVNKQLEEQLNQTKDELSSALRGREAAEHAATSFQSTLDRRTKDLENTLDSLRRAKACVVDRTGELAEARSDLRKLEQLLARRTIAADVNDD